MNTLKDFNPDRSWSLFLDRDGVINVLRENDYVKNWSEFEFIEGTLESIAWMSTVFGRIVIVTNQQGVGKGIMSEEDLTSIHAQMIHEIERAGGRVDKIYHCPHLAKDNPPCRKPEIEMGLRAQKDFPEINFSHSIMVGDSEKDMIFSERLGMIGIRVKQSVDNFDSNLTHPEITKLSGLASYLKKLVQ